MEKKAFTTSEIASISHHSRETVKRWLEKGEIKGYRVGTSGHWRVLPKDLAVFLQQNNIPFPEPEEIDIDLRALFLLNNAVYLMVEGTAEYGQAAGFPPFEDFLLFPSTHKKIPIYMGASCAIGRGYAMKNGIKAFS